MATKRKLDDLLLLQITLKGPEYPSRRDAEDKKFVGVFAFKHSLAATNRGAGHGLRR